MKTAQFKFEEGFRVAFDVNGLQVTEMGIAPGDAEGGSDNRHAGADQWLYVVAGTGIAIVEGERHELGPGSLIVIERGESHEVRNTGFELLRTLNLFNPPAFDREGNAVGPGRG